MTQKTLICLYTHGGGMRGIIPAMIMQRMEERTGLAMVDMVDIFSGPSTGSILNAALNIPHPHQKDRPKYKALHLVRFYEREGRRIFPQDALREFRGFIHDFNNRVTKIKALDWIMSKGHYDPTTLGKSLRALYGRTRLADSLKSLIIPVYNIGEATTSRLKFRDPVTSFGSHAVWLTKLTIENECTPKTCSDVSLFNAVMGSTAAPTFYPCHEFMATIEGKEEKITGIDGSIFDNVPTTYMSLLRYHIPQKTKFIMIVLGTGITKLSFSKEQWNNYGSLGIVDPANDLPLINIFFHAAESALSPAFEEEIDGNLFVFNKSLIPNESNAHKIPSQNIDDARPENIKRLKQFTEELLKEHEDQLNDLCDLLVKNYRQKEKAKSRKWGSKKSS